MTSESRPTSRVRQNNIGGKTPLQILAMLGAKGEAGGQPDKLEEYRRIFGFLDANDDGDLSTKEFIEDGRYMTRQARQGIFRASDANGDGVVSEQEYVTNRIITDEAKAIMAKMDEDGDGKFAREEFIGNSGLPEDLSNAVFERVRCRWQRRACDPRILACLGPAGPKRSMPISNLSLF